MIGNAMRHELQWTKSHPERIKPRLDWTADDHGIYMADLAAGELAVLHKEVQLPTFSADAEELLQALVPAGQWVWMADSQLFTGSLRHSMERLHHQRYLVDRDKDRQRRNAPPRWIHNGTALMVSLTHAKQRRSTRARGRLVNHLYDWMAHESNLAKGADVSRYAPCVEHRQRRLTSTPPVPTQPCKINGYYSNDGTSTCTFYA